MPGAGGGGLGAEERALTLPHPSGRQEAPKASRFPQSQEEADVICLFPWGTPAPYIFGKALAKPAWLAVVELGKKTLFPTLSSGAAAPVKTRLSRGPRGGGAVPLGNLCPAQPTGSWGPLPHAKGSKMTNCSSRPLWLLPAHTRDDKATSGSRILASGQRWSPSAAGRLRTTSTAPQARREGRGSPWASGCGLGRGPGTSRGWGWWGRG